MLTTAGKRYITRVLVAITFAFSIYLVHKLSTSSPEKISLTPTNSNDSPTPAPNHTTSFPIPTCTTPASTSHLPPPPPPPLRPPLRPPLPPPPPPPPPQVRMKMPGVPCPPRPPQPPKPPPKGGFQERVRGPAAGGFSSLPQTSRAPASPSLNSHLPQKELKTPYLKPVKKGLFWSTLKQTIESEQPEIDYQKLAAQFAIAEKTTKAKRGIAGKQVEQPQMALKMFRQVLLKTNTARLLSSNSRNTTEQLIDDILHLRLQVPEEAEMVLKMVGSSELLETEIKAIRGKGSAELPTPEEAMLLQMYDHIPNVVRHVETFIEMKELPERLQVEEDHLKLVRLALETIRSSSSWKAVAKVILSHWDYMKSNGQENLLGTTLGFEIDSLRSLQTTKTTDNKSSLLDYIVGFVQAWNETHEIHQFVDDFEVVERARCMIT